MKEAEEDVMMTFKYRQRPGTEEVRSHVKTKVNI